MDSYIKELEQKKNLLNKRIDGVEDSNKGKLEEIEYNKQLLIELAEEMKTLDRIINLIKMAFRSK